MGARATRSSISFAPHAVRPTPSGAQGLPPDARMMEKKMRLLRIVELLRLTRKPAVFGTERVGPGGLVIGVEPEDRFFETAQAERGRRGLQNVKLVHADASCGRCSKNSYDFVHEMLAGYLRLQPDSVCVEDPSSPAYNTITSVSSVCTPAFSAGDPAKTSATLIVSLSDMRRIPKVVTKPSSRHEISSTGVTTCRDF
jgi:hypothetical protein